MIIDLFITVLIVCLITLFNISIFTLHIENLMIFTVRLQRMEEGTVLTGVCLSTGGEGAAWPGPGQGIPTPQSGLGQGTRPPRQDMPWTGYGTGGKTLSFLRRWNFVLSVFGYIQKVVFRSNLFRFAL